MEFSKYSGAGNDFVLIDDRTLSFPIHDLSFIKHLCDRQRGIGADGLILVQPSSKADFRMRIFNADSSEAEMCGNGVRCLGLFIKEELGFPKTQFSLETTDRLLQVFLKDEVAVEMGEPTEMRWSVPTLLGEELALLHILNTGVPHAIWFVDDLDSIDLTTYGKAIRFHPLFAPKGVNANFVAIQGPSLLGIRTYERGVEAETLACGTGATAAALAAAKMLGCKAPVRIHTCSNDVLTISFDHQGDSFKNVLMQGPALCTFKGCMKAHFSIK